MKRNQAKIGEINEITENVELLETGKFSLRTKQAEKLAQEFEEIHRMVVTTRNKAKNVMKRKWTKKKNHRRNCRKLENR